MGVAAPVPQPAVVWDGGDDVAGVCDAGGEVAARGDVGGEAVVADAGRAVGVDVAGDAQVAQVDGGEGGEGAAERVAGDDEAVVVAPGLAALGEDGPDELWAEAVEGGVEA